ncbi:UNVERIFIED_CONTAM: hypothetical protein GTU68_035076 [Idotea baltica]|nr:hypothetical protein [Idotea baltica]
MHYQRICRALAASKAWRKLNQRSLIPWFPAILPSLTRISNGQASGAREPARRQSWILVFQLKPRFAVILLNRSGWMAHVFLSRLAIPVFQCLSLCQAGIT